MGFGSREPVLRLTSTNAGTQNMISLLVAFAARKRPSAVGSWAGDCGWNALNTSPHEAYMMLSISTMVGSEVSSGLTAQQDCMTPIPWYIGITCKDRTWSVRSRSPNQGIKANWLKRRLFIYIGFGKAVEPAKYLSIYGIQEDIE